ncbi:MAG: hypothetical protein LBU05_05720 [Bifidobacteriaceae bacterium]|jgi:mRNA-degrading endonuclease RelE of RelBE toxin-antitoxin system|nr:hypothetical protein [Bifidobacteriaceae bacterium]
MSDDWRIEWTAEARHCLRSIPPRVLPALLEFISSRLAANPPRVTHALPAPFEGKRSGGPGPYRVIVTPDSAARVVYINRVEYHSRAYRPR